MQLPFTLCCLTCDTWHMRLADLIVISPSPGFPALDETACACARMSWEGVMSEYSQFIIKWLQNWWGDSWIFTHHNTRYLPHFAWFKLPYQYSQPRAFSIKYVGTLALYKLIWVLKRIHFIFRCESIRRNAHVCLSERTWWPIRQGHDDWENLLTND